MRNLPSIVANYDSASTGFGDGKLRDNTGDDTGSGVMSAWGNDIWYALRAIVTTWHGAGNVSDTPESENNHDVLDAIEQMIGLSVYGVDAYNPATTYSTLGESVMYAGMQFVNINATSNLGKTPLTEPAYWMPCPNGRELFVQSRHGIPQWGASHPIHDYNNSAYRQYFGLGTHRLGGYNGTTFNAYGIHLDGQGIGSTGTTLSNIVEAWHLKDIWMPGTAGSRSSVNAMGRLLRAIEATGGQADLMAEVLDDQMQGHRHGLLASNSGGDTGYPDAGYPAVLNGFYKSTANIQVSWVTDPKTDGVNGTPRTGAYTRDKSVTGGVPYMVVMVPAV